MSLWEEAKAHLWFHSVDLGGGHFTDGTKTPTQIKDELSAWSFPADLRGKTVLDIGCADGAFSIEAIRRGGAVTSIDERPTRGMQFFLAHPEAAPGFNFLPISLFSDAFTHLPAYDVILFAGVLYHVHDQLEALKRVRSKTRELVVFETAIDERLGTDLPYAVFYEKDESGGDLTNWWGPNIPCLEGMLRTAGFAAEQMYVYRHESGVGRCAYHLRPA